MYKVTEVNSKLGKCRRKQSRPNEKVPCRKCHGWTEKNHEKYQAYPAEIRAGYLPKYKSEALIFDPTLLIVNSASDPHSSAKKKCSTAIFLIPHTKQ